MFCSDVSKSKCKGTYCMYVVRLVTVSIGFHYACMW